MDITNLFNPDLLEALADFFRYINHNLSFRLYSESGDLLYEDNIYDYMNRNFDDDAEEDYVEYISEYDMYDDYIIKKVVFDGITLDIYISEF